MGTIKMPSQGTRSDAYNSTNLSVLPQILIHPLWTRKKPPSNHSNVTAPFTSGPDNSHDPSNLDKDKSAGFGFDGPLAFPFRTAFSFLRAIPWIWMV
jgi:hypothetical protein